MPHAANIYRLGIKELWSLARDPVMLVLIAYTFTVSIYVSATAMPETLHKAPIAIVDEDGSPLSARIVSAFYRPHFNPPAMIPLAVMDAGMDAGDYTFALDIPPDYQRDVLAGRSPAIQLNVDATRMSQAFTGSSYIQQMLLGEVAEFVQRYRGSAPPPVDLALRARFNPNLEQTWFGALMEIINNVTMLSIILTGAALIREREHGTIEHLLVMPVTPSEIMLAKIWSRVWWCCWPPSSRWCSSCKASCVCRSKARCLCSWLAPPCTCSLPLRWPFSWPRWHAPCRSSGCWRY